MPVLKCSDGKYRIGSGKCMYSSKAKAIKAYAAYRAISHSEAEIEYLRSVVNRIKKVGEDTTTSDIAKFVRAVRMVKKAVPKKDGTGAGVRANIGRGGCVTTKVIGQGRGF